MNWEVNGVADVEDEFHLQCRKESSDFHDPTAFPAILKSCALQSGAMNNQQRSASVGRLVVVSSLLFSAGVDAKRR
jgi:hypothetical protein